MENYHLTKKDENWRLAKEGANRAAIDLSGLSKTQAIQESAAFLANSGSSLKIHKQNGQFQEERTYPRSMDPRKTKG